MARVPVESACSKNYACAIVVARKFPRGGVSGAAELHQVKIPARKNSQAAIRSASQVQKRKKPGSAGLFDEYLFQSVHFASLAI
jgi:hypothetical protein